MKMTIVVNPLKMHHAASVLEAACVLRMRLIFTMVIFFELRQHYCIYYNQQFKKCEYLQAEK